MRYITLDVYRAMKDYDHPTDVRYAFDAYERHLAEMEGVLPQEVLALARLPSVDDGWIVDVRHDADAIILTMRCGDLQVGYYDLVTTYEGASMSPEHERVMARIARDGNDVAYHEVDITDDGGVEHRVLFHPGLWFAIRCRSLRWERIPKPDHLTR